MNQFANEKTAPQAAEYLGFNKTAFLKLCKAGEGPRCRRDGKVVKFLPEHLDAWAEDYKAKAYSTDAAKPKSKPKAKTAPAPKAAVKPNGKRAAAIDPLA